MKREREGGRAHWPALSPPPLTPSRPPACVCSGVADVQRVSGRELCPARRLGGRRPRRLHGGIHGHGAVRGYGLPRPDARVGVRVLSNPLVLV